MTRSVRLASMAGMIAMSLGCVALAQERRAAPQPPVTQPPRAAAGGASADEAPRAPTPLDPRVDQILTRLENTRIASLRTGVTWKQRFMTDDEEDATTKRGELAYLDEAPVARFLVRFNTVVRDKRSRNIDERHLFDGRFYVRLDSTAGEGRGVVERREIRRSNDPSPYRVGEGQFPMPFGQRKADVLREYEVSIAPVDRRERDVPPQTDHLLLKPRPGSQADQKYGEVHMWIGTDAHPNAGMPLRVRTFRKDPAGRVNDQLTVDFHDPALNAELRPDVFVIETPRGYQEEVERLPPENGAP